MTLEKSWKLPALRKQHLLTEFSSLKYACPEGVFLSLTPGDATLWSGVMFIRRGPYAPSILRFQISFPSMYPSLPPLITLSTDIFHPLVTPLTTYRHTTDIQDSGTVSATDDERLGPGGFSLRHGFPRWFGRAGTASTKMQIQKPDSQLLQTPAKPAGGSASENESPESGTSDSPIGAVSQTRNGGTTSTYDVLKYVRSTFDDDDVLDAVPLEAAGNPGAWHARRAHRVKLGKLPPIPPAPSTKEAASDVRPGMLESAKPPGEWNWDGVWEVRVKRGIENSLSEPVLYGNSSTTDDLIRFLNLDVDQLETVKENLKRSVDGA